MENSLHTLHTFTVETLPDLDVVTLGALELFNEAVLPIVDYSVFKRPIVIGSGNAAVVGRLLFDDIDAVFADESSYEQKLAAIPTIDGAILISASGSKHAIAIASKLQERSIPTILLTTNAQAPAQEIVGEQSTFVFPKNREPYTYNTSTYMGMLLSKTFEDTQLIAEHIQSKVLPSVPKNLTSYDAFYFIIPEGCAEMCEMFRTKFDELFGPQLLGRIFTYEQTKHAKTVIPLENELFISLGVQNKIFGDVKNRMTVPLPVGADYVAVMAVGYFIIGHIQKQFPPYYKDRIEAYTKETSEAFGAVINPIVE